jgi:hypothetical protein
MPYTSGNTTTAWLFTRGTDSIRIEANVDAAVVELFVKGPGKARAVYRFADIEALIGYQVDYERDLVARGYTLEEFKSERRRWPR